VPSRTHPLKHRWRLLASLAKARNHVIVRWPAHQKRTHTVSLEPCNDSREQGWSATFVATATAGMDGNYQLILKYSQLSQSSLACRNHLVWNEQPPAIVPNRDQVPHRFHGPIYLMDRFTYRRKRR
jgi:hypothetical protein